MLLKRSKAYHWMQNCFEILQNSKNSGEGFHPPPFCTAVRVWICVYVQGLKQMRNECTPFAIQVPRPKNGGPVSSWRSKDSVPSPYFWAKCINTQIKWIFFSVNIRPFYTPNDAVYYIINVCFSYYWLS